MNNPFEVLESQPIEERQTRRSVQLWVADLVDAEELILSRRPKADKRSTAEGGE